MTREPGVFVLPADFTDVPFDSMDYPDISSFSNSFSSTIPIIYCDLSIRAIRDMERRSPMNMPALKNFEDLLSKKTKAFASLALVLKDGTPQVTPVWFGWDGELFVVNTARGRVKDKVLHRHPVVALTIMDPANPYRYLQVKGPVVFESEQNAYEHICDLQEKYRGNRDYPKRPGEVRVIYKIKPEKVQVRG